MLARDVQLILEHIPKGNHASAARIYKVCGVLSPAATATQQTHAHSRIGSGAPHQAGLDQHRTRCSRCYRDEFSSGNFIR